MPMVDVIAKAKLTMIPTCSCNPKSEWYRWRKRVFNNAPKASLSPGDRRVIQLVKGKQYCLSKVSDEGIALIKERINILEKIVGELRERVDALSDDDFSLESYELADVCYALNLEKNDYKNLLEMMKVK